MKILITGSSGLIGSALRAYLGAHGHDAIPLLRERTSTVVPFHGDDSRVPCDQISRMLPRWNPRAGTLDWNGVGPFDAVVHLAGENIASGRWTRFKKDRILRSRVDGSRLLARSLASLPEKPRVLIAASAVGIYGNRGDEPIDETSSPGEGFLAETCVQWERAMDAAAEAGIRVVHLRLGMVLSSCGGALAKLLPLFRFGLGGRLGNGAQIMSWVSIDDVMEAIVFAMEHPSLYSPVNLVSPHPTTNRAFTKALADALHRPTLLPVPAQLLRLALGEMADELLLGSACVAPTRLLESGYHFRHPDLREALENLLSA